MPHYTIRVELHKGTWDDYVELHKHLAVHGIVDTITSDEGVRYKLPPAEYNYEGNNDIGRVVEICKQSAAKVVQSYAVLVTEANRRSWYGLQKVVTQPNRAMGFAR